MRVGWAGSGMGRCASESQAMSDFPLLTVLVVAPAAGALLVALVPRTRPELSRLVGVAMTTAVGAMSVVLVTEFETAEEGFQLVSRHAWIEEFGISWHLGVDGISLFLVVLTGVMFPIVILGTDPHHDTKRYLAWMLLLEAGRSERAHV